MGTDPGGPIGGMLGQVQVPFSWKTGHGGTECKVSTHVHKLI